MNLTLEELQALYHYDPFTGIFTCKRNDKTASSLHNGYVRITINRKDYYAHRLAYLYMTGNLPTGIVDHKNHIKSDNRWDNLREVSHQENCRNMPQYCNNSSGSTGIYWHKRDKNWVAFIYVDSKKKHLGCFKEKSDAIFARHEANHVYGFYNNHGKEIA